MKKLIYYLIFLLALIMMLLACSACRSPKTMTYSQATTDSVNLSVRDSTTQRFSFTFDSLVFSNTDYTDYTNEAPIPSGRLSVKSVLSVFNKNLPCSHLVVYGGKLSSNSIHSVSHDSTSTKTTQEIKTSKIRPSPSSLITNHLSLIIIIAILLLFHKLKSKVSS